MLRDQAEKERREERALTRRNNTTQLSLNVIWAFVESNPPVVLPIAFLAIWSLEMLTPDLYVTTHEINGIMEWKKN